VGLRSHPRALPGACVGVVRVGACVCAGVCGGGRRGGSSVGCVLVPAWACTLSLPLPPLINTQEFIDHPRKQVCDAAGEAVGLGFRV
jgi:hypothetical protein